jgi:hypothetical protein
VEGERLTEVPVRLCCGQRHWSVICPDGLVQCCICFERVPADEVWEDSGGQKWDVCRTCGADME